MMAPPLTITEAETGEVLLRTERAIELLYRDAVAAGVMA
jgi:hypothetical protein